ncbi:MAG: WD40 repeat domain-containing protein [bacterium]
MFKQTLRSKGIACLIALGLLKGIGFAEENKLKLELVREIRLKEKLEDVRVMTSEEEVKKARKMAGLSSDEPIFPVKAIRTEEGIKFFDAKGRVEREIKGIGLLSENGEYFFIGNEVRNRNNTVVWKNKELKGEILAISNNGRVITTNYRFYSPEGIGGFWLDGLYLYDSKGNLIKEIDVELHALGFRTLNNTIQFSSDGSIFACWENGNLNVFSSKGNRIFRYSLEDKHVCRFDKLRVSPDGRYIVVSTHMGGTTTIYPKGYWEKIEEIKKMAKEKVHKMVILEKIKITKTSDYIKKREEEENKILKEMGLLPKEVYNGPYRGVIFFFTKEGNLLGSYNVVPGEKAIAFSPEGDYVGVGDYEEYDYNVYLFETQKGTLLWKYHSKEGIGLCPDSISISSGGKYICVGLVPSPGKKYEKFPLNRYIYLFDPSSKLLIKKDAQASYPKYRGGFDITIDPDGNQIFGMTDETLLLFKITGGDAK